eukprot:NODE_741_length_634_cov_1095.932939_g732_i0.p1 GENE.NODE_741_length_634_cov_1095.932939_g732_i0~~NODE_741_length_634_cov_1095.932939_g732_i0.p1  ORF type:complete len:124 (-),score=25.84 NODE_741_length_634_cov_1095.932939_g732_i0:187-558(-)
MFYRVLFLLAVLVVSAVLAADKTCSCSAEAWTGKDCKGDGSKSTVKGTGGQCNGAGIKFASDCKSYSQCSDKDCKSGCVSVTPDNKCHTLGTGSIKVSCGKGGAVRAALFAAAPVVIAVHTLW